MPRRQGVHSAIHGINDKPADKAAKDKIPGNIPAVSARSDWDDLGLVAWLGDRHRVAFLSPVAAVAFLQGDGGRGLAYEYLRAFFIGYRYVRCAGLAGDRNKLRFVTNDCCTTHQIKEQQ